MINLTRLRPTRTTLAALVAILWAVSFGALRDFVWADLRAGFIDLRGLSRPTRFLVIVGFGLLMLMIGALLLNDVWRSEFTLLARLNGTPGRGALIPISLVPATLFLLAMAWAFALTGALHSHPLIRLGAVLLYVLSAAGWTNTTISYFSILQNIASREEVLVLGLGLSFTFAVPLFFVLRWRGRPRPIFEFIFLLLLVTGMLVLAQSRDVERWHQFGIPIMLATLQNNVDTLQGLVIPLLLLIGIDMAGFAAQVAHWTTQAVTLRLPRWLAAVCFFGIVLWRLQTVIGEAIARVSKNSLDGELVAYAGALGILVGVGIIWGIVSLASRRSRQETLNSEGILQTVDNSALPLIIVYSAVQLIVFVLLALALAIPSADFSVALQQQVIAVSGLINDTVTDPWHLIVAVLAIGSVVWLTQRGHKALALYLGIFGVSELWYWATNAGNPLAFLTWSGPEPLDFWWVVLIAGVALFWFVRRELTAERVGHLFMLMLITALLRQTDFIGNRFSPLFGFAGVGFIAFGIIYDAITAGTWANVETKGLPRSSRIFLYVGYVLLTVTVVNWALAAHDLNSISKLTGGAALVGMERFGRPMLYAIFAVVLAHKKSANPANLH